MNEDVPRVQIIQDKAGEWRWRLLAANGETLAVSSESYTRDEDAVRGWRATLHAVAELPFAINVNPQE